MSPTPKELIAERVDCRTFAEARGVAMRNRAGERWTGHCFNPDGHNHGDRNPSLAVWRDGFKCFGCGEAGDLFDLARELEGWGFVEALANLAELAGVEVEGEGPRRRRERPRGRREVAKAGGRAVNGCEGPLEGRVEVWRGLWELVDGEPLTDAAREYLEDRGLDPGASWAHGARDLAAVADLLVEYLRGLTPEEWKAAGLLNRKGDPWAPLATLKGERDDLRGLTLPVYHPAATSPVGLRWRVYQPGERWPPKVLAPPATPWTVVHHNAPAERCRLHYMWPHYHPDGEGPTAVVLVEGETDYLAVASALVDRDTPWRVIPVGLCAMAGGWPEYLAELLTDADRVICMFDAGAGKGEAMAKRAAVALVKAAGRERAKRVYRRWLHPDGDDLADRQRRGELWPQLQRVLEEEEGR